MQHTQHLRPSSYQAQPTRCSLAVVAVLATLLAAYVLASFAAAMLLAAALAVTCQPWWARVTRLCHGRQRLSAALCAVALLFLLIAPLAGLGFYATMQVRQGIAEIQARTGVSSLSEVPHAELPNAFLHAADPWLQRLHLSHDDVQRYGAKAVERLKPVASAIAAGSAGAPMFVALTLLGFYFFLVDGHRIPPLLQEVLPLQRRHSRALMQACAATARAALLGNGVVAVIQSLAVGIGFAVAGVPQALLLAALTVPTTLIPVVGSALVWVPTVIALGLSGRPGAALALAGWCGTIATINTNVIKPAVVGRGMAIHGGLLLLGILGGIKVFGMIGLLAGPLAMSFVWTALELLRDSRAGAPHIHAAADTGAERPQPLD